MLGIIRDQLPYRSDFADSNPDWSALIRFQKGRYSYCRLPGYSHNESPKWIRMNSEMNSLCISTLGLLGRITWFLSNSLYESYRNKPSLLFLGFSIPFPRTVYLLERQPCISLQSLYIYRRSHRALCALFKHFLEKVNHMFVHQPKLLLCLQYRGGCTYSPTTNAICILPPYISPLWDISSNGFVDCA